MTENIVLVGRFQLLDKCLEVADPELYAHLRSKNLSAELYAFPCECAFAPKADLFAVIGIIDTDLLSILVESRLDALRLYAPA